MDTKPTPEECESTMKSIKDSADWVLNNKINPLIPLNDTLIAEAQCARSNYKTKLQALIADPKNPALITAAEEAYTAMVTSEEVLYHNNTTLHQWVTAYYDLIYVMNIKGRECYPACPNCPK